jgi:hypothetical protein
MVWQIAAGAEGAAFALITSTLIASLASTSAPKLLPAF